MHVVSASCSDALMLVLTFAPCACGVLSTGTNTLLAHVHGGGHHLQLLLVVLFHSATGTNTSLATLPSANCAGGVFLSSYRYKYCTGTYATCTVLWWSVMVIFT